MAVCTLGPWRIDVLALYANKTHLSGSGGRGEDREGGEELHGLGMVGFTRESASYSRPVRRVN